MLTRREIGAEVAQPKSRRSKRITTFRIWLDGFVEGPWKL